MKVNYAKSTALYQLRHCFVLMFLFNLRLIISLLNPKNVQMYYSLKKSKGNIKWPTNLHYMRQYKDLGTQPTLDNTLWQQYQHYCHYYYDLTTKIKKTNHCSHTRTTHKHHHISIRFLQNVTLFNWIYRFI